MCVSIHKSLKNMKQTLNEIKGETDKYITVVGDFNTPFR